MKSEESEDKPKNGFDGGAALKNARLKKGLRQEEIARALRIPVRQVQAVEHNRSEEFPAPVYYRGTFQAYCEMVDLDFLETWRQANPPPEAPEKEKEKEKEKPKPAPRKAETAAPEPEPAPKPAAPAPRHHTPGGLSGPRAIKLPQFAPSLMVPGAIFLALLIAAALVWFVGRGAQTEIASAAKDHPKQANGSVTALPTPQRSHRHMLKIEPTSSAWVRIRADRKFMFEGNLPAGRATTWEGDKSFSIRTPREGSLKVWVDDQELDIALYPHDSFGNILIQPGVPPPPLSSSSTATSADVSASTAPSASAPPLIP